MPPQPPDNLFYVAGFSADANATSSGQQLAAAKLRELRARHTGDCRAVSFVNAVDALDRPKDDAASVGLTVIRLDRAARLRGALLHPLLPIFASSRLAAGGKAVKALLQASGDAYCYADFSQGLSAVPASEWKRFHFRQHDIVSTMYERRARVSPFPVNLLYRLEALRARKWERSAWAAVASITTLSESDARIVRATVPRAVVRVEEPRIAPRSEVARPAGSAEPTMIFWGNMSRFENVDAITYFVSDILPTIVAQRPDAKLLVVGAHPDAKVTRLQSERITVTGYVPDPKPYFDAARVAIAPIRVGAGVKIKVLETLAAGLDTVASPVGAEGITPGPKLHLAADSDDFARQVVRVLNESA